MIQTINAIPGKLKVLNDRMSDQRANNIDNIDVLVSSQILKSIQRGINIVTVTWPGIGINSANILIPISSIDISKSFIKISFHGEGTNGILHTKPVSAIPYFNSSIEVFVYFTSRTNTPLVSYPIGDISWEVIEFT
jgi:hypothetical protein